MKVKTSKGFTLAELLIVMAIIVVLAAIAIPTFGKQLETARETSDEESLRAALTDAFTQAYVDYANDKAWTHGETAATVQGVTVASGSGAYVIDFSALPAMIQTQEGFNYITPKFRVGSSATNATFTETAKIAASSDPADAVVFVFAPNATAGKESEITLTSVTLVKKAA